MIEKFKNWYRGLPGKKRYFELLGAVLSVPVLLTVILLNLNALQGKNDKEKDSPAIVVTVKPGDPEPTSTSCKKEVGPVEIVYPRQNQTVNDNPLCIDVSHKSAEYCSVLYSYKLDDGSWSNFSDKQMCFYNLSSGSHTLQLKVKSSVSQDQKTLETTFTFSGPTPTIATSSAALR